jgi:hypothetical protein
MPPTRLLSPLLPLLLLAACAPTEPPPVSPTQAPASAPPAAAAPAPSTDTTPFDPAPPAGLPDLREIFGEAGGWDLPALKGLRNGMTPAEAGAVYPGAEVVSSGFSEVKVPFQSVASCTLRYNEGKLFGVTFRFVKTPTPDVFFDYLARFGQHAFGPGRLDYPGKLATWVNQGFQTAQVAWTFDRYKLDIDLPRPR